MDTRTGKRRPGQDVRPENVWSRSIFRAAGNILKFLAATRAARTRQDIDAAAQLFARACAQLSIATLITILTRGAAKIAARPGFRQRQGEKSGGGENGSDESYIPKSEAPQPWHRQPKNLRELQKSFDELAEKELLPKYKAIDPNLEFGYKGSFKTGVIGNPNRPNFGKPVSLDNFDIDAYIKSDILRSKFGSNLRADAEFRKILEQTQGFEGLRPNKKGFSIKFLPSSN